MLIVRRFLLSPPPSLFHACVPNATTPAVFGAIPEPRVLLFLPRSSQDERPDRGLQLPRRSTGTRGPTGTRLEKRTSGSRRQQQCTGRREATKWVVPTFAWFCETVVGVLFLFFPKEGGFVSNLFSGTADGQHHVSVQLVDDFWLPIPCGLTWQNTAEIWREPFFFRVIRKGRRL